MYVCMCATRAHIALITTFPHLRAAKDAPIKAPTTPPTTPATTAVVIVSLLIVP